MSRPPSSQTTPQFYRVSDRDLTEIELHSVDSINDLHRVHPELSHKGMRPPRPAYSPSSNGNLYTSDLTAVNQRGRPISCKWQRRLQDLLTASSSHAYAMGCAIVTLLLITVLLIFYFLGEIPHSFVVSCFLLMYPGIFVSSLKFASLNIFVSVVSFASSPAGRRRPGAD
ncbi:uncharacterized protein LOC120829033 isoform X1 [Gasterosteus aculeatus]